MVFVLYWKSIDTKACKQECNSLFHVCFVWHFSFAKQTHPSKTSKVTWFLTDVTYYCEICTFFFLTLLFLKAAIKYLYSNGIEARQSKLAAKFQQVNSQEGYCSESGTLVYIQRTLRFRSYRSQHQKYEIYHSLNLEVCAVVWL